MHRVKEFEPRAWATSGPDKRVFIQLGFTRFTATAEEAEAFAEQLIAVAEEVRSGRR
jgi:hypothetical protein